MKNCILIISFALAIFSFKPACFAQTIDEQNLSSLNIEALLPPLETIIDSALARNPYVKYRDQQIDLYKFKLKTDKVRWTENLGIQSDARYGTFDNFSLNTAVGQTPSSLATRSNQLNYGVGAYIKLPLFDFINHKNLVGASKAEADMAVSQAVLQRDELRQSVIKQYYEVIMKHRVLKIRSRSLETSRISAIMSEKEFQNGINTLSEYSRISEVAATAEVDFERSKIDFISAFALLEEIAKTKFEINKPKQSKNGNN